MFFWEKVWSIYTGSSFDMNSIPNIFVCLGIGLVTALVIIGIPYGVIALFNSMRKKRED